MTVDGRTMEIDDWVGSHNHNWGARHTDRYAWGQVEGFDDDPGAVLECSTARLKLGPVWTPWLTLVVLRVDGAEYALNDVRQALRTRGRYRDCSWTIDASRGDIRLRVAIDAPREAFVTLAYDNPSGGVKTCLNTKLARCRVLLERAGRDPVELRTRSRAAFELLS
jgi:hypothetical protein